jgi:hypothetical protein
MRVADLAVLREQYPIPAAEKMLQDFDGSTAFSHQDLNLTYLQTDLALQYRAIKAFQIH